MPVEKQNWQILLTEPDRFSPRARVLLEQLGAVTTGPLERPELLRRIEEVDILFIRLAHRIDAEVLGRADRLRAIVTPTTGVDHVDGAVAGRAGVTVLSLRGETGFLQTIEASAEHTWALLLAMIRRIVPAAESVRLGEWSRDRFWGTELAGKKLGVVGLGRIGRKVSRFGAAFQMQVAACDPCLQQWPEGVRRVSSLLELASRSDVLTVHVPLNRRTRGLIGEVELAALPAGAVVINTARGEVIDEAALIRSLRSGHLGGAALDVVTGEPARPSPEVLALSREIPNLLITPHIAGATRESVAKTELFMAEKLRDWLAAQTAVAAGLESCAR